MSTLDVGLGFKAQHFQTAMACTQQGMWFEVHAENYMVAGGIRLAQLDALAEKFPLSLHGVGLSIAADAPPDATHLKRLAELVTRYQPALVSEHLAWSHWQDVYSPDLLPVVRNPARLQRIADNINQVQNVLGRTIALENPSHYLPLQHEIEEPTFLAELQHRTDCTLLLDINNIFVSAHNLNLDVEQLLNQYLKILPHQAISEIHLAGHEVDANTTLLIDGHNAPIDEKVWALYQHCMMQIGARPTLIERDDNLPEFSALGSRGATRPTDFAKSKMMNFYAKLGDFENQFTQALWADEPSVSPAIFNPFSVYRNTTLKGCVDAIQANFLATTHVVGETWMRAAATIFVRQRPPASPVLALYGAGFAEFLRDFEPAQTMPYLWQVARLDYAWIETYFASDATTLKPETLAQLPADELHLTHLRLHPSCRFLYFSDAPIYDIWQANHAQTEMPELQWNAQSVVLARPQFEVLHQKMSAGALAFLQACQQHKSISAATEAALDTEPEINLHAVLAEFLNLGVFASIENLPMENV